MSGMPLHRPDKLLTTTVLLQAMTKSVAPIPGGLYTNVTGIVAKAPTTDTVLAAGQVCASSCYSSAMPAGACGPQATP